MMLFRLDRSNFAGIASAMEGLAFALAAASSAQAGSYRHQCDPVGKSPFVYDPTSERVMRLPDESVIPHKIERRVRLKELIGNCVSGNDLFRFRQEVYGLFISVEVDGKMSQHRFLCSRLQYTTPEGRTCDREVRRSDWAAPEKYVRRFMEPGS